MPSQLLAHVTAGILRRSSDLPVTEVLRTDRLPSFDAGNLLR